MNTIYQVFECLFRWYFGWFGILLSSIYLSGSSMNIYLLILFSVISWFSHSSTSALAADTVLAIPKKGVTVTPPLSERLPARIKDMSSFGSITWKTEKLPWVKEGPYAGISGASMSVHNGKIYVVGGFIPGGDGSGDLNSNRTSRWAWAYHPESNEWKQLPDAPFRREYTRSILTGDKLYLIGGGKISKGSSPPYKAYAEIAVLDLSLESPVWRLHSNLNIPRTHTSVGSVGQKLIVVGGNEYDYSEKGYSFNTIRNTTEVFDLSNPAAGWQIRTPLPNSGRGWSASITNEKYIYLFGGLTWNSNGSTSRIRETMRYDPVQDKWKRLKAPPVAISGWEAGLYKNRYAIMAGGVMQSDDKLSTKMIWSDLVWSYDLQKDKWARVKGPLPPGAVFNDPGVSIIGDTIYVLGAEGPAGSHYNYFLIGKIKTAP
jgi:Kelch motif/Galactose oxidase, central domain